MAKPEVLFLGTIDHAHQAFKDLAEIVEILKPLATCRSEFIEECNSGRYDNVVAIFRTFYSVKVTGLWDEELVNALPKNIKFCCHNGAGYDQIDVAACSARNPPVRVSNVPTAVDDSTADTAMFLMLGALRGFNYTMTTLREGKWRGNPAPPRGHDPRGKVLGILGMGGIGRNMSKKAAAFGMTTIYHNRNKLSEELAGGAQYVSFDELLAQSDVLSLNLPLNKHTHHIIGATEFAKMKKGVVIINTARGAVMDEDALVNALESGQVLSAGLDVFEKEPTVHPGLLANKNVMLLPHVGTDSIETIIAMEEWALDNVRQAVQNGKLKSPVPEQTDL